MLVASESFEHTKETANEYSVFIQNSKVTRLSDRTKENFEWGFYLMQCRITEISLSRTVSHKRFKTKKNVSLLILTRVLFVID